MKSANALFWLMMAAAGLLAGTAIHFLTRPTAPEPVDIAAPRLNSFHDGVVSAAPAVVSLYTETFSQLNGSADNPLYNNLFGQQGQPPLSRVMTNQGSGVIISSDGYILTNRHLIDSVDRMSVVLADGRHFPAVLTGSDRDTDLAVLKVSSDQPLPSIRLAGDSTPLVGDIVLAIGNPYGFGQTVTMGIVSATGRQNITDMDLQDFIQIDAAINPGNSGGALINPAGELVGINTAIATRNGFYQGYGFAIPINLARKVVTDLERFGRVRRGILGVVIEGVTDATARASGLDRPIGALVQGVTPGSPARRSGLEQGDIITEVNGQEVVSVNDLQLKIASHYPGEKVTLTVWRGGEPMAIDVILAEAPGEDAPAVESGEAMPDFEHLGIATRELSDEERGLFRVDGGVLIESIASGSPAERAGMYPGAVIVSLNEEPVSDAAQFERRIEALASGEFAKIRIKDRRRGVAEESTRIVFVEVP